MFSKVTKHYRIRGYSEDSTLQSISFCLEEGLYAKLKEFRPGHTIQVDLEVSKVDSTSYDYLPSMTLRIVQ